MRFEVRRILLCLSLIAPIAAAACHSSAPDGMPDVITSPTASDAPVMAGTGGADAAQEGVRMWTEIPAGGRAGDFPIRASTYRDLARAANPAVVSIFSTQATLGRTISDPLGIVQFGLPLPRIGTSLGSGFIIRSDGYVLTADHVVAGGRKIKIVLMADAEGTSKEYDAVVMGRSKEGGVALLKIVPETALPALPLGDSSGLQIGDQVLAVGNPYGLSHTVTSGIVSFIGRELSDRSSRKAKLRFIQIDAPINPGNSGGPLLNLYGEVVGINTAVAAGAEGIGFAIPINRAKESLPRLLRQP